MLVVEPVTRLSTHDDLVAAGQQRVAEVRAEEAGAAGDDDPRHRSAPADAVRRRSPRRTQRRAVEQVAGVDDAAARPCASPTLSKSSHGTRPTR